MAINRKSANAPWFLTGYRGTGKTTVARLLAEHLGWRWLDADDEIERIAGESIAEIFAGKGESGFRDLEEQVVEDLCRQEETVIALGGGAILRQSTRKRLAKTGPVVWLTATAETLGSRIASDETSATRRPGLTGLSPLEEVRQMLAQREPLYRECATLIVDTQRRTPAEVVEAILAEITPN